MGAISASAKRLRDLCAEPIPFPAIFQVVERDAVVDAVDRARRFEQLLEQRNRLIVFAGLGIDHREVTKHDRAVDGVFRDRLQLHRAASFADRIFLAPEEGADKAEVGVNVGDEGRLLDGGGKFAARLLEERLRRGRIAPRQRDAPGQQRFRSVAPVEIVERRTRRIAQNIFRPGKIALDHGHIPARPGNDAIRIGPGGNLREQTLQGARLAVAEEVEVAHLNFRD